MDSRLPVLMRPCAKQATESECNGDDRYQAGLIANQKESSGQSDESGDGCTKSKFRNELPGCYHVVRRVRYGKKIDRRGDQTQHNGVNGKNQRPVAVYRKRQLIDPIS